MAIDYFKTLCTYLGRADFVMGVDVILQDDGDGVYIKHWGLVETEPTMQQLTTTYSNNTSTCSCCVCNCSDSANYGNPCRCAGKIISSGTDLTLNSRVATTVTYSDKNHDCFSELDISTGIFKIKKTRKIIVNFLGTLDDMPLDSTFEIWVYKGSTKIASNRTTPSIIDDITLSVSTAFKGVVGDEYKIVLYNGSLISKLVVDYTLTITSVGA